MMKLSKSALTNEAPFIAVDLEKQIALDFVDREIDNNVVICVSSVPYERNDFHPQMSVEGILEGFDGLYRVLLNDSTYTYFTHKNVMGVVKKSDRAVIYLNLSVNADEH